MSDAPDAPRASFGSFFADLPGPGGPEAFDPVAALPGARIERITSHGHETPPGEWYDQAWDEWVLVLTGGAILQCEGEAPRAMSPGDWAHLPAHVRHRVEATAEGQPTVWLAVHAGE
ncbi:cupin domain-containing protein [Rhodovulum sp. DZ06]|uniref:cupin domain-containing protein n=1 Tax=Rhodovulum sp. DZ06 TaxID=3425126 RepID=UPI003D34A4CF